MPRAHGPASATAKFLNEIPSEPEYDDWGPQAVIDNEQAAVSFELKKTHKIRDRSEFVNLSRSGRKLQDHFFVVLYTPGAFAWSRLGITVSRRVGNAVERNRLKRIIREWFRLNRRSVAPPWDVNVIAKKSAAGLSSHQIFKSMEKIFQALWGPRH
jgi:ribonuclease P protein component